MRSRFSFTRCTAVLLVVIVGLLFLSPVLGQEIPGQPQSAKKPEPATVVEKFIARRGRLLVKDYYKVGTVQSHLRGSLEIQLLVLSAPGATTEEKVFGMRFERPAVERYESSEVSFLDFDECTALLEALAFMDKLAVKMALENHENTEVIYETRGGMTIGFVQDGREQTAFVEVGGPVGGRSVFLTMDSLRQVNALLQQAATRLRDMGAK